jgi:hypothetical protein
LDKEIITGLWFSYLVKVKDQHIAILKGINVGVALEAVLQDWPSCWMHLHWEFAALPGWV